MISISNVNIRRPGLRIWSILHRTERRLYWFRAERMNGSSNGGRTPLYSASACTVWEPRDLWIGVYWDASELYSLRLYIGVIPCLPLRLHFKKSYGAGGVS